MADNIQGVLFTFHNNISDQNNASLFDSVTGFNLNGKYYLLNSLYHHKIKEILEKYDEYELHRNKLLFFTFDLSHETNNVFLDDLFVGTIKLEKLNSLYNKIINNEKGSDNLFVEMFDEFMNSNNKKNIVENQILRNIIIVFYTFDGQTYYKLHKKYYEKIFDIIKNYNQDNRFIGNNIFIEFKKDKCIINKTYLAILNSDDIDKLKTLSNNNKDIEQLFFDIFDTIILYISNMTYMRYHIGDYVDINLFSSDSSNKPNIMIYKFDNYKLYVLNNDFSINDINTSIINYQPTILNNVITKINQLIQKRRSYLISGLLIGSVGTYISYKLIKK